MRREVWASRIGLVLAAAGNAIGLGNLLRFPSKVALYGGGAFMLPYFLALFFMGIPLMFLEWVIGAYGGVKGRGSMVGIFGAMFKESNVARIIGSLGVVIPLLICCYYIYIESWTLGFAWMSLFEELPKPLVTKGLEESLEPFLNFLRDYLRPSFWALFFLGITLAFNAFVLLLGIRKGIEKTAIIGIPLLIGMGVFLAILSLSLKGGRGVEGLLFIFKADLSKLADPQVWIEATGQIFFTLSLGMGCMAAYASYIRKKEAVLKAALQTTMLNEVVEIGLGATIAIPAAFAMFGASSVQKLAQEGTFRIGFMSMPAILLSLPLGNIVAFMWFSLLFLAALTSSLALAQPVIAFFEEERGWPHRKAVLATIILISIGGALSAFVPSFIDELDFWIGTLFLVIFALVETVAFVFILLPKDRNVIVSLSENFNINITRRMSFFYIIPTAILTALLYQWIIANPILSLTKLTWNLLIARLFIIFVILIFSILSLKLKRDYFM